MSELLPDSCTISVPPTFVPVSLTEVKSHLRITSSADDTMLTAWSQSAADVTTGITGHQWAVATFEARYVAFGSRLWIPRVPLAAVSQVAYINAAGSWVTVDAGVYSVATRGVRYGYIEEAPDQSWPETGDADRPVKVTFTAGYATANDVPPAAKLAICQLLAHWYLNREAVSDVPSREVDWTTARLLSALEASW